MSGFSRFFNKLFHKKNSNTYSIDLNTANEALQNVFAACEQPPNTIPFDKLVLRQRANTKSFTIGKYISIGFILLLFIMPFVFPHSPAKITQSSGSKAHFTIEDHYVSDSTFTLVLSGDEIDYSSCYAIDAEQVTYLPVSSTPSAHTISFPYIGKEINLYIYNNEGQYMQLLLSPIKR